MAASLFTFSLHFLLTELIVVTSKLCEATTMLSVLALLSTVGALVGEGLKRKFSESFVLGDQECCLHVYAKRRLMKVHSRYAWTGPQNPRF